MKKVNRKKVLAYVIIAAFAIIILLTLFVTGATAEEFAIIGYGSREFAVKGDVEQQALKMVESWGAKKPAKIIVQGFADRTGKTAENDTYARDRASEMRAFLETKTDAKIIAMSKGESENVRQVVVTVEYVVVPVPALAEKPKKGSFLKAALIFMLIAIFLVAIGLLIFSWSGRRKKKAGAKANAESAENPRSEQTSIRFAGPVKITINGVEYNFYPEVTLKDGRFKTFHEIEPGKFMFVGTKRELKKSLHSTFKKDPGLVEGLINKGRLKPIS